MKILNKIYIRSFFLQAVWNYERMQNIGFLYSIFPKLASLYKNDKEEFKKSIRRYLGYFNTHPYMALFLLGFVSKQEEKIKEKQKNSIEELNRFKLQLAGPLAAIGDKLFWSTWRPLIGLLGVLLFFLGLKPYYLIPLIFLTVYNLPIIIFRYKALLIGYDNRSDIVATIKKTQKNVLINMIPTIGLIMIAVILILINVRYGINKGIICIVATALVVLLRKKYRISATRLLYYMTAASILGHMVIKL